MFDISFFELLLCAVVMLVVIGPERLPETVRTISLWIGRLKRSLRETRSELEKQLGADDIRRQLHNEEIMSSLEKTRREIESAVKEGENLTQTSNRHRDYIEHVELPDHAHMDEEKPLEQVSSTTLDQEAASAHTETPIAPDADQKFPESPPTSAATTTSTTEKSVR